MRIVIDDAGDVPDELVKKYDICIVPVNITFGTEQYLTVVDLDHAAFYAKTKTVTAENFPKSSQPTPYQFAEYYKKILAEGENQILTITVGQKFSGTYASAQQAANELADKGTFYLFDSQAATAVQGMMAIEAAQMNAAGHGIEEILVRLEQLRETMAVVFTIDSLEYAVKGGRISSMKSVMASLLNIKPILRLVDGQVVEDGRVRTRKKAMNEIITRIRDAVGDQPVKMAIIHAGAPDEAALLRTKALAQLNATEDNVVDMAISVAINLGPGALGLAVIPDVR